MARYNLKEVAKSKYKIFVKNPKCGFLNVSPMNSQGFLRICLFNPQEQASFWYFQVVFATGASMCQCKSCHVCNEGGLGQA